jgi:hypothetical protein
MPRRKTAKKRPVKKKNSRFSLPYPLVIFLMLCAGFFLAACSLGVSADDVLVTASIKAPPISSPAIITSPSAGGHFSAVPITVSGSCPPNAAYIELFRNGFMGGSAICSSSSTFEIQTDLFPGANELTAHSFNSTDDEGPLSDKVLVYYDVPQKPAVPQPGSPAPTTPDGTPVKPSGQPLSLKTAFVYKGYYVNQPIEWPIEISGGTAPYAFNIDWGDNSNSVISRKDAGQFNIKHTYTKPGGYRGNYKIRIQSSDFVGNYAYMEFFIIVNAKTGQDQIGSIYSKPPPSLNNLRGLLWVAWPAYATIFLLVIAFKLGERQELSILRRRGQLRRS